MGWFVLSKNNYVDSDESIIELLNKDGSNLINFKILFYKLWIIMSLFCGFVLKRVKHETEELLNCSILGHSVIEMILSSNSSLVSSRTLV